MARRDSGTEPATRDLLILGAVAIAARLLYLLAVRDEILFQAVVGDSEVYVGRARALLAGMRADHHVFTPPLYPLYLATVFRIWGENLELVRWLQAAGGVVATLAVAWTAGVWFGRMARRYAGLVMALSPVVLFFEGELLSAAPVLCLVCLSVAAAALGRRDGRPGAMLAAGACLGGAALGQPNVLLLAAGLACWAWGRRSLLRALAAGGVIVVAAGVGVQHHASGYWAPISAGGGVNLYIGNHPAALGGFELPADSGLENAADGLYPSSRAVAEAATGRAPMSPPQVSRYWAGRALAARVADPAGSVRLVLRKLLIVFNHHEIPNHYDIAYFGRYSPLIGWNPIRFVWVAPLGVLGIGWALRRRQPAAAGLALAVGAYSLGLALFFITSRYRLPLWPFLAIGGGAAVTFGWETWRTSIGRGPLVGALRRPAILVPSSLLAALILLSALPRPLPFSPAHTPAILAAELNRRGDARAARQVLEEAALHDQLPEVAHNLANAYYRDGRYADAAGAYARALELRPDFAPSLYGLGMCELQLGRPHRAVELLSRAAALDPADRRTRRHLGRALLQSGRADEAVVVLGGLLDDEPTVGELFDFGLGCVHVGRLDSARTAFESVLEIDAGNTGAQINLALIEEQRGHLAEARRMLLALDETAPDSVERLIALGRIEARLGRREAALGHYRRALVLAPDDRRVQRGLAALGEPGR